MAPGVALVPVPTVPAALRPLAMSISILASTAVAARALRRAEIDAGCDVAADLQGRTTIRPGADRQLFKPEALPNPAKRIAAARCSAAQLRPRNRQFRRTRTGSVMSCCD